MLNSKYLVSLLAGAFVVSQVHLIWMLAPLEPNLLVLQLAFSAEDYWRILGLWGTSGVAIYRAHFAWDAIHPFIYGALGYFLVANTRLFAATRPGLRRTMLFALPLAGALDLVENTAQLFLLAQPPGTAAAVVALSASCSALKWGLAAFFAAGVGWCWWTCLREPS